MTTPKIHFAALIKPENDLDILTEFASHYSGLDFDSQTVYLHEGDDLEAFSVACDIFTDYAFKIRPVSKSLTFRNGQLRQDVLNHHRKSLPGMDYFWTADADEIQAVNSIRDTLDLGSSMPVHVLMGQTVDRYDLNLHDLPATVDLDDAFPFYHENLYQEIFGKISLRDKVICSKAWLPVDLNGSHKIFPFNKPNLYRMRDGVEIQHFRWRKCMLSKFKEHTYLNQNANDFNRLKEFFAG